MIQYLNSLRVRLVAALLLLVIVGVLGIILNNQTATQALDARHQIRVTGEQRTNAYVLASLARRLAVANTDVEKNSVLALIGDTIQNFDTNQAGLRNGDDVLELKPIREVDLLAALDALDTRWATYRALLESFIEADSATRNQLMTEIDDQSANVYAFAVRVDRFLDIIVQQEAESTGQVLIVLVVVAVLATMFAIYVIIQIIRSTNALAYTARQLATGNLKARAGSTGMTELAILGNVLNDMAEQIEARIVETEAALARAERSDKVKSAFLASMSHELRTPLNAIINFSKFLNKGIPGPINEEQGRLIGSIADSGQHLLNLINDVLDMSKIESGSLSLYVESDLDLHQIIATAIQYTRPLLADKPVELQEDIPDHLPTLTGDRKRLLQVFLNVLSNACKFTEKGFVKLRVQNENDHLLVSIEDTGAGIAPEDSQDVFTAFKQTESGLRQGGNGTGLGMPISQKLVEAHEGRIWFESKVGAGTTFYIDLPLQTKLTAERRKQSA